MLPERAPPLQSSDVDATAEHASLSVAGDERERILEALRSAFGNQTEAARMLGISRQTLLKKLDRLGVGRPRKGNKP
jgi:DNA-binding NtrC family response regulator